LMSAMRAVTLRRGRLPNMAPPSAGPRYGVHEFPSHGCPSEWALPESHRGSFEEQSLMATRPSEGDVRSGLLLDRGRVPARCRLHHRRMAAAQTAEPDPCQEPGDPREVAGQAIDRSVVFRPEHLQSKRVRVLRVPAEVDRAPRAIAGLTNE